MAFKDVKIGENAPNVVHAIVEIPKGSRNKYEVDLETGTVFLDRVLFSPLQYPYDYGHIVETEAADGDPLDILVMSDEGTFPGCVVQARPIGMLRMEDEKGKDEKILAVSARDPRYAEVFTLKDLAQHRLLEIEHFFTIYKTLEDKKTIILGWTEADGARIVIALAHQIYRPREQLERKQ
ncbi:MAG: inorganic diphosphatase [bacterium]